jgi:hypothetical protein
MTPQERQCIDEFLEAATLNGVAREAAARLIGEVMLNFLTKSTVAEIYRVRAEELDLYL